MIELTQGQKVRVKRMGRTVEAIVVRFDDETARVMFRSGTSRTIKRSRIVGGRPRRVPLSVPLGRVPVVTRPERAAPVFKAPPTRDAKYLEHVRSRPCCICLAAAPSDPHHFGPRGLGQKTDDRRTVPLCRRCHDRWHDHGAVEPYSRAETEREFYRAQVDALLAWSRKIG
ncbi:MAG TPA: DUF968 domain-containing protein [Polyangiaceae bacterium]|nr:DUF968 domain-containing protein [Polyangiaceae bacterium]